MELHTLPGLRALGSFAPIPPFLVTPSPGKAGIFLVELNTLPSFPAFVEPHAPFAAFEVTH